VQGGSLNRETFVYSVVRAENVGNKMKNLHASVTSVSKLLVYATKCCAC